ncbi:MAG: hypothetical protein GOU99_02160 [Candidatus Altiarchaeota archaeon]|nr:hypothetical protein [Candidatus Altiarchaeota archaeon]
MDKSKIEQIGFHKGALTTLMKERNELTKMVQTVDQLMNMHIKALEDLGVQITGKEEVTAKFTDPLAKEE